MKAVWTVDSKIPLYYLVLQYYSLKTTILLRPGWRVHQWYEGWVDNEAGMMLFFAFPYSTRRTDESLKWRGWRCFNQIANRGGFCVFSATTAPIWKMNGINCPQKAHGKMINVRSENSNERRMLHFVPYIVRHEQQRQSETKTLH